MLSGPAVNPSALTASPTFVRHTAQKTAPFGELLVAVFDEAACYSTDPEEISRMATEVVTRMLRRAVLSRHDR